MQALVLAPTRELALQVSTHLTACLNPHQDSGDEDEQGKGKAGKKLPPRVSVATVVGGMSAQKQRRILDRGVDVLVATPGRLWDIIEEVRIFFASFTVSHCRIIRMKLLPRN